MLLTYTTPAARLGTSSAKGTTSVQRLLLLSVCLIATTGWFYLLWNAAAKVADLF
jgi:hypothetical protein